MKGALIAVTAAALAGVAWGTAAEDDAIVASTVTQKTFRAPFGDVWEAAVNACIDMGLQIGTLNEEGGLISCPNTSLSAKEFKKAVAATGWTSKFKNCRYQATILIRSPGENITTLRIMLKLNADEEKSGSIWDLTAKKGDFQSNGTLENEYFEYLSLYLPQDLEVIEKTMDKKIADKETETGENADVPGEPKEKEENGD
jgi:hypothetical protein